MSERAGLVVEPLALHPHLVAPLSEAFAREWPAWAASVPRTELDACFASAADAVLPIVFVALVRGLPVGTLALRPWFAQEPMEETPWVRGLLVLPEHRGGAVFRALESAVERYALACGIPCLYAATTNLERVLTRRGWEVFRRIDHQGTPMAWLKKVKKGSDYFFPEKVI